VQFAVYSIIVVLLAAPPPTIGGHLPDWLKSAGLPDDLRFTFYTAGALIFLSALVARRIREPGSGRTGEMLRNIGLMRLPVVVRWWAVLAGDDEPESDGVREADHGVNGGSKTG